MARRAHDSADRRNRYRPPQFDFFRRIALPDEAASRAVGKNKNLGALSVLRVRRDEFDRPTVHIEAFDFPEHAPVLAWGDDLGLIKVEHPIAAASRIIFHGHDS